MSGQIVQEAGHDVWIPLRNHVFTLFVFCLQHFDTGVGPFSWNHVTFTSWHLHRVFYYGSSFSTWQRHQHALSLAGFPAVFSLQTFSLSAGRTNTERKQLISGLCYQTLLVYLYVGSNILIMVNLWRMTSSGTWACEPSGLLRSLEDGQKHKYSNKAATGSRPRVTRPPLDALLCFPSYSLVVAAGAVTSLPVVTQTRSSAPIIKSHWRLPDRPVHTWLAGH